MLVVIEGIDTVTKINCIDALKESLSRSKVLSERIDMSVSPEKSMGIQQLLGTNKVINPDTMNVYASSMFAASLRCLQFEKNCRSRMSELNKILFLNEYTSSTLLSQMPKLGIAEWAKYVEWLTNLEYSKVGIPQPDLVFFLNTSRSSVSQMSTKLMSVVNYCASKLNWEVIDGYNGNTIKSVPEIVKEVQGHILSKYQKLNVPDADELKPKKYMYYLTYVLNGKTYPINIASDEKLDKQENFKEVQKYLNKRFQTNGIVVTFLWALDP